MCPAFPQHLVACDRQSVGGPSVPTADLSWPAGGTGVPAPESKLPVGEGLMGSVGLALSGAQGVPLHSPEGPLQVFS